MCTWIFNLIGEFNLLWYTQDLNALPPHIIGYNLDSHVSTLDTPHTTNQRYKYWWGDLFLVSGILSNVFFTVHLPPFHPSVRASIRLIYPLLYFHLKWKYIYTYLMCNLNCLCVGMGSTDRLKAMKQIQFVDPTRVNLMGLLSCTCFLVYQKQC